MNKQKEEFMSFKVLWRRRVGQRKCRRGKHEHTGQERHRRYESKEEEEEEGIRAIMGIELSLCYLAAGWDKLI